MSDHDSPCRHTPSGYPSGRVSWPVDRPIAGEAHASTYVCGNPECISACAEWVQSITGHLGVFVPFPRRARTETSR